MTELVIFWLMILLIFYRIKLILNRIKFLNGFYFLLNNLLIYNLAWISYNWVNQQLIYFKVIKIFLLRISILIELIIKP